jgi:prepilin-type N-terminal cleavage/methylation domain-containing protein
MRPTPKHSSGFTLVELMMALAVLGVLLAVAVPLYNDYTTRARVAQLLTNIDVLRTVFHTQDEVEGGIPKFTKGDAGKIPPELSEMPISDDLLQFDHLQLRLFQSSSHYGPFDGKNIPYLGLTAGNHGETKYLTALAHALPHSAYAWIVEPMAMVVPLLNAETRHASHAVAKQPPATTQPAVTTNTAQPQTSPQVQQPLSCTSGQDKVTIPASVTGSAFDVCVKSCGPGEVRDAKNPLSCVATAQPAQSSPQPASSSCPPTGEPAKTERWNNTCVIPCPSGLKRGNDGRCHSFAAPAASQTITASSGGTAQNGGTSPQGSSGSSGPTAQQQYDDCVAHVHADHPHGHANGLIKQCERNYPH